MASCRLCAAVLISIALISCAHRADEAAEAPRDAAVKTALAEAVPEDEHDASWHLGRAGRLALDPALYVADVIMAVPQFLRPLRAAGTLLLAPFKILFPPGFVLDLARVPGDLAAPFAATWEIVAGLPRLVWSPVRALWHLGAAAFG